MKTQLNLMLVLINLVLLLSVAGVAAQAPAAPGGIGVAAALGTAFTYQGRLTDGGGPANGAYDFQFKLYDSGSAGNLVGSPNTITISNQTVTDGLFAVVLDFGAGAFAGEARYLEVGVRPGNSSGTYTTLTPRQALTPAPYSLRATSAGSVPWSGITGVPPGFADGVDNQATVPLNLSGSQPYSIITAGNNGPVDFNNGLFATGVLGVSSNGRGLEGDSTSHFGVAGFSGTSVGVFGRGTGTGVNNVGVYGIQGSAGPGSNAPVALLGTTNTANGIGVFGLSTFYKGVEGYSRDSYGVQGYSMNSHGVYGSTGNSSAYAGYFAGNVRITGSCCGAIAGTYQIDHPLDPANKYLYHASVESSEMKNIYDGTATLDANGAATVTLPAWFEALNGDFRYQLTTIGGFAPIYIAQEIQGNRFTIAGGKPGMKVSWQVTGIRHDPYAARNPLQVEADKPAQERGKYLYPEGYNQPQTKGEPDANAAAQTLPEALSQPATP